MLDTKKKSTTGHEKRKKEEEKKKEPDDQTLSAISRGELRDRLNVAFIYVCCKTSVQQQHLLWPCKMTFDFIGFFSSFLLVSVGLKTTR